eukprot:scaffold102763_cov60-Phaeocystis_antarctica.AAC.1
MLPLRVAAARGGTVGALLRAAREAAVGGIAHAALPLQQMAQEALPRRVHDASRNGIFQAKLLWGSTSQFGRATSATNLGLDSFGPSLRLEPADLGEGLVAQAELTLVAETGASGGIEGAIEYNRDLFARESVERLAARLAVLAEALAGAADDDDTWALPLLPAAEAALVLRRFNETAAPFPAELCVHDLVVAQAARTPDAVAL